MGEETRRLRFDPERAPVAREPRPRRFKQGPVCYHYWDYILGEYWGYIGTISWGNIRVILGLYIEVILLARVQLRLLCQRSIEKLAESAEGLNSYSRRRHGMCFRYPSIVSVLWEGFASCAGIDGGNAIPTCPDIRETVKLCCICCNRLEHWKHVLLL